MSYSTLETWAIILLLGLGTFLIRFSFLGVLGNRPLPEWAIRHLRYTAVAVMPGLIAPLVLFPAATGGAPDAPRLAAAAATLAVGIVWRNALAAIAAGIGTLYAALFLLG